MSVIRGEGPARVRVVLVTGSREWTDHQTIEHALAEELPPIGMGAALLNPSGPPGNVIVRHGGAAGADSIAASIVRAWGYRDDPDPVTPEEWRRFGKRAGHLRNWRMVERGADVCLAFPLGRSPGTRGCMDMCRRAGIPVREFGPSWFDADPYSGPELAEMKRIMDESPIELTSAQRFRLVRMMQRRGFRPDGRQG